MDVTLSRRGLIAAGAALATAPLLTFPGAGRAQGAGPSIPLVYPRRLGDLEVTAISDGHLEFTGEAFVNIDAGRLAAALEGAYLDPAAPFHGGVTAYLVRGGDRTMLVDAGTADLFGPGLGKVPAALSALGVAPSDIEGILCTHLHPDHIGGLVSGAAAAYPNAALHVGEADIAFFTNLDRAAQAPSDMRPFFDLAREVVGLYADRLHPFVGDGEILPGVRTVALPGHTPGHSGFLLEAGAELLLVFGDAAHSAAVQFSHPEASFVFDLDPVQASDTRRRLFERLAADRQLAAASHLPWPAVGHVARSGDAFAWLPEEWRYQ